MEDFLYFAVVALSIIVMVGLGVISTFTVDCYIFNRYKPKCQRILCAFAAIVNLLLMSIITQVVFGAG